MSWLLWTVIITKGAYGAPKIEVNVEHYLTQKECVNSAYVRRSRSNTIVAYCSEKK